MINYYLYHELSLSHACAARRWARRERGNVGPLALLDASPLESSGTVSFSTFKSWKVGTAPGNFELSNGVFRSRSATILDFEPLSLKC